MVHNMIEHLFISIQDNNRETKGWSCVQYIDQTWQFQVYINSVYIIILRYDI